MEKEWNEDILEPELEQFDEIENEIESSEEDQSTDATQIYLSEIGVANIAI